MPEMSEETRRLFAAAIVADLKGYFSHSTDDKAAATTAKEAFYEAAQQPEDPEPGRWGYKTLKSTVNRFIGDKNRSHWATYAEEYGLNAEETALLNALPV